MKSCKLYYYETKGLEDNWGITGFKESEIKKIPLIEVSSISAATLQNLLDYYSDTGEVFEGLLEIEEGLCQYQYRAVSDDFTNETEIVGEYILIAEDDNVEVA
jgi:hypothetical protein